jgi:cellulose synthase/poly-beta-1,6-N-acetylglucosamine synthase-like glycosyltransferase
VAGALAEGLKTAKGEFVAIFDADFTPPEVGQMGVVAAGKLSTRGEAIVFGTMNLDY